MPRHVQELLARQCCLRRLSLVNRLLAPPRQVAQTGLRHLPSRRWFPPSPEDVHREKGIECKECHNVHFIKQRQEILRILSRIRGPFLAALAEEASFQPRLHSLPWEARQDESGGPCRHHRQGRGEANPRSTETATIIVSTAEWHAFDDLLRTRYRGSHRVTTVFRVEANPHTIKR